MCFFWRKKKAKKEEINKEATVVETQKIEKSTNSEVPAKGTEKKQPVKKNTTSKTAVKKEATTATKKPQAKKTTIKTSTKTVKKEEVTVEDKVITNKVYHVSLRKADGKWQVKYGGGKKAIKLFDTQAEAIKFAEERAESQDGSISIHKRDGKIRKQDYSKKEEGK